MNRLDVSVSEYRIGNTYKKKLGALLPKALSLRGVDKGKLGHSYVGGLVRIVSQVSVKKRKLFLFALSVFCFVEI
jgi:hypothetical protein